jgi:Berberine and berberine like
LDGILAPVYALAQPSTATVQEISYWDAQLNVFSDTPSASDLQNRTLYFRGPISPAACAVILKWLRQWPGTSIYANVSFLRTGGQANEVPSDATAFVHRNNDWFLVFYLKWDTNTDSEETINANLAWLSAFYDELAQFGIGEAYQNFLDPSLTDYLRQYYGSNLGQLRMIKCAVDPMGVFRFPQGIPPCFGPVHLDLDEYSDVAEYGSAASRPIVSQSSGSVARHGGVRSDVVHGGERAPFDSVQGQRPTGGTQRDHQGASQDNHPSARPKRDDSGGTRHRPNERKHHGR